LAQNPSALKRQKELARQEYQRDKEAKRKQRKAEKEERAKLGLPPLSEMPDEPAQ
jgi:hypothetical protein